MVESKSETIKKRTTITFEAGDIESLVKGMKNYLENGEVFEVKLEDKKGQEVVVTLAMEG